MYKVLLVDDEKFILDGLSNLIKWGELGLEIVGMARGGRKALEFLAVNEVDILITDISMPGMNGLELIRKARQDHSGLKVIILSGYNEFDYLKEGMSLGIENYLLKPVDVSELMHTLVTLIEKLETSRSSCDYTNDIHIIRNNTLHRWMTGQIAASEWKERCGLLQLGRICRYRLAAVIRKGDYADRVYDELVKATGDNRPLIYRDLVDDVAIIYQADNRDQLSNDAQSHLRELLSTAEQVEENQIRIGLGQAEETEASPSHSYDEAKKALEYFLLFPDERIIRYEMLNLSKGTVRWGSDIRWENYIQLLHARNTAELTETILEDFSRLQQQEGMPPGNLWRIAAEITIRLKLAVQEVRPVEPELLEKFSDHLELLHNTVEWGELMEALGQIAQLSVDLLQTPNYSPVIQQVLKLVNDTYTENWTLMQLGDRFHIHPVYLGQLFRKETGENFAGYMNRYRIEQAKRMLRETNLKIHQVARDVGYWEVAYFNRQFRRYVGVSPMEYKTLV